MSTFTSSKKSTPSLLRMRIVNVVRGRTNACVCTTRIGHAYLRMFLTHSQIGWEWALGRRKTPQKFKGCKGKT